MATSVFTPADIRYPGYFFKVKRIVDEYKFRLRRREPGIGAKSSSEFGVIIKFGISDTGLSTVLLRDGLTAQNREIDFKRPG